MNNKGKLLNNKGFTLVELLAVVTILVAFSLVAITNTSASLKRNTSQKDDLQEKLNTIMNSTDSKDINSVKNLMKLLDGKLEIESNIGSTTRFSWCMEEDDIVSALEIILGIVQGALEKEKELLRRENEIEKIDHLNAPVKHKEIYINNAKKEDKNI